MRINFSTLNIGRLTVLTAIAVVLVGGLTGKHASADSPESDSSAKVSPKTTLQYAREIDRLIDKHLSENEKHRNDLTDDETFLRRIYLNAIGRIPNIDEAESFLSSDASQKRAQLIDELLDSYGYVSHQFNFWADILRIKTRVNNGVGQPYIDFVKDSLEENKPYDEFVRELLSASGPALEPGNGAVGYYLRDVNMPEDNMSNTVRVFLGTRLECAQCHDHPFDKWTQKQYFEMVAFTGGMKYTAGNQNLNKEIREFRNKVSRSNNEMNGEVAAAVRRTMQVVRSGISGTGTGLARLPENYEGTDGGPNEVVTAKPMFGDRDLVDATVPQARNRKNKKRKKKINNKARHLIPGARDIGSREAYAQWMTEVDNPRFAKVIANRLWKQSFGLGLIEPVDVIEDSTIASNPELMDYLTTVMIEIDFDLKEFLRIIYNTETWQAEATRTDIAEPHKYDFPGPVLRRMTAEQMWDSMIGLTIDEVDVRDRPQVNLPGQGRVDPYEFYNTVKGKSIQQLYDMMAQSDYWGKKKKKKTGADEMMDQMSPEEMRKQRRQQMAETERAVKRRKKKESEKRLKAMNAKIQRAKRSGNQNLLRRLLIERTEMVSSSRAKGNQFKRASELQSPAPAKHFLREFGQSDREVIENSNSDPAVTQVLRLMNGFVDNTIGKDPNSVLTRNALIATNEKDAISNIYVTMLSRKPTRPEIRTWSSDFKRDTKAAYTDLVWTLINSNEFIFVK